MSFANSIKLHGLTTREAIADAFYRIMSAFDENDSELLESGMSPNIVQNFRGQETSGFANVKQATLGHVGAMDTTHFVTSIRIDVENDKATTAKLTANSLAQHYPAGTGATDSQRRLLAASKHAMTVVKDEEDGLWKVERWDMKIVWYEGDVSVMASHP